MTGKEALKLAQDTILAHNGNNKSSFTMKMLYQVEEELNEKDKKLAKYKRAFEILKDKGVCVRNDRLYFDYEIYIKSTKEERELLEELINK